MGCSLGRCCPWAARRGYRRVLWCKVGKGLLFSQSITRVCGQRTKLTFNQADFEPLVCEGVSADGDLGAWSLAPPARQNWGKGLTCVGDTDVQFCHPWRLTQAHMIRLQLPNVTHTCKMQTSNLSLPSPREGKQSR